MNQTIKPPTTRAKLAIALILAALGPHCARAATDLQVDDAFVRGSADGQTWTIGTQTIELTLEARDGRLRTLNFKNKLTDPPRNYVSEATAVTPFSIEPGVDSDRFNVVPVWSKFLPLDARADPASDKLRLTVKRGDLIGFAVGPHGSYTGDQTQWITTLEYDDGERYCSAPDTNLAQGPIWFYYVRQPNRGFLERMDAVEQQSVAQEWVRIPSEASGYRAAGDVPHVGATMIHPSDQFDAVRVWKAPKAGTVTVSGVAEHVRGQSDVDLEILRITEESIKAPSASLPDNPWTLEQGQAQSVSMGGRPVAELELVLSRATTEPARVRLRLAAYPRTSVIRQWVELENSGATVLSLKKVQPFAVGLNPDEGSEFKQLWMIGANCNHNQGTIPEQSIADSFHHSLADNGTRQLVPWTSLQRKNKDQDGWFLMLDQEGPWRISVDRENRGPTVVSAESFGFQLPPGQRCDFPLITVGVYRDDLEDMGRRVYDWVYEYLWDYTHHEWYARTLHLDEFHKFWNNRNWNLQEKFTARLAMIMDNAAVMLRTGAETLWDDIAWWEEGSPDPFNGPDFAILSRYFAKNGMKRIGYFTGNPGLHVLNNKVGAWGNFQWRTDFCSWGRGNPGAINPQQVRTFRDLHPRGSFHSCSGGGGYNHGFELQRLADVNQMSDASPDQSNHYFSYLELPDKWQNTFGAGEGTMGNYNPDVHRRILTHVPSWFGRPRPDSQEAVRHTVDLYHFLIRNGVAGRWSYMFHPSVKGDREWFYAQRTSFDRTRACIILKHRTPDQVIIYPRGLLEDHPYVVGFDSKSETILRQGSDLMAQGIVLTNQAPGELIYLGLPHRPGSGLDQTAPAPPARVLTRREVNAGCTGVSIYWSAGTDNHWVSYYDIKRDEAMIGRASARTYFFDGSQESNPAAAYAVRTVDGDGNKSGWQPAARLPDEPLEAQSLGGHFDQSGRNGWSAETSADGVAFQPMVWVQPGEPGAPGGLEGYWQGAGSARVGRGWQQSSTTVQCVRAWTAPEQGTVRVMGRAMKEFWHRYGNSLRVKILHGARQVWPAEGWAEARPNDLRGCQHDLKLDLAKGDTIRFVLDQGASPLEEVLAWMPRIVYPAKDSPVAKLSVVRILCGAPTPYEDHLGNVWSADREFTGGHAVQSSGAPEDVQPTPEDGMLYSYGREGKEFTYSIPVEPGLYSLRLKFAEMKYEWFFQRPFNLEINGQRVLSNFDICQAARGPRRGYEKVFRYQVPDAAGRFVLRFTGGWEPMQESDQAMVQAIEILPEIKPAVRIDCGSKTDFIDWNSFLWSADRYFEGGEVKVWTDSALPSGSPAQKPASPKEATGKETYSPPLKSTPGDPAIIEVTPTLYDQELYKSARAGTFFRYGVPVPPGLYSVHLKFAELWMKDGESGNRPMNIVVNGRRVWENWDPATAAGQTQMAADLRVEDIVPDTHGQITIQVSAAGENEALLQAIEIE